MAPEVGRMGCNPQVRPWPTENSEEARFLGRRRTSDGWLGLQPPRADHQNPRANSSPSTLNDPEAALNSQPKTLNFPRHPSAGGVHDSSWSGQPLPRESFNPSKGVADDSKRWVPTHRKESFATPQGVPHDSPWSPARLPLVSSATPSEGCPPM